MHTKSPKISFNNLFFMNTIFIAHSAVEIEKSSIYFLCHVETLNLKEREVREMERKNPLVARMWFLIVAHFFLSRLLLLVIVCDSFQIISMLLSMNIFFVLLFRCEQMWR